MTSSSCVPASVNMTCKLHRKEYGMLRACESSTSPSEMPDQVSPLPIQRLHLWAPWASCWPLSRSSSPSCSGTMLPVIILPLPAQSGSHLFLLSFYPSASLPDFLHAWIPSLATQLWTDISELHSKPTRTQPLQRKHLEDNTHLSNSVHLRACE